MIASQVALQETSENGGWWVADVTLSEAEGSIVTVAYRGSDPEQPDYEVLTIAPGGER